MKSLWPTKFDSLSTLAPKNILQDQASQLSDLTEGVVIAEATPYVPAVLGDWVTNRISRAPFMYCFDIVGPYLNNYRFRAMHIGHDITLYPVVVMPDVMIAEEIGIAVNKNDVRLVVAANQAEFEEVLSKILQSNRLRTVVSAIRTMSSV